MVVLQCLFCEHGNRAGAKFCEDCGSPLHLKLCKSCEAINQRDAESCHKCGTKFPIRPALPVGASPERQTLTNGTGGIVEQIAKVAARQPDTLRTTAPSLVARRRLAYETLLSKSEEAPSPSQARTRTYRRALPVLLVVAILGSAYYIYHHPKQATPDAIADQPTPIAPSEPNPASTASTSTAVTTGAGGASTVESTAPAPPANSSPQPAAETARADAVPSPAVPEVPAPSDAARANSTQRDSKQRTATRPSATQTAATARPSRAASSRQEQRGVSTCSEGVAALGLCTPGAKRESN